MAKRGRTGETIAVRGLSELNRDLNKVAKGVRKELVASLKLAAVPVVEQSRANLARFHGASLDTIRARVRVGGVSVEQSKRKVTGTRPDWGGIQMVYGLIPALEERQGDVVHVVEVELDRFTTRNGLPMKGGMF